MIEEMPPTHSAADFIPPRPGLPKLRQAIQDRQGCDLHRYATQASLAKGRVAAVSCQLARRLARMPFPDLPLALFLRAVDSSSSCS